MSAVPEDRTRRLYGLALAGLGAAAMAAGSAIFLAPLAGRLSGLLRIDETEAFFLTAAGGLAVAWGLGKGLWSAKEEAEHDRRSRWRREGFF